jgi:hypothetical protein
MAVNKSKEILIIILLSRPRSIPLCDLCAMLSPCVCFSPGADPEIQKAIFHNFIGKGFLLRGNDGVALFHLGRVSL